MNELVGIVHAPPVLAAINYLIIEVIKRVWERIVGNIPNRLVPLISTGLGTAVGFLPVVGDPLIGAVVGAASSAIHDILSPRPDGPK